MILITTSNPQKTTTKNNSDSRRIEAAYELLFVFNKAPHTTDKSKPMSDCKSRLLEVILASYRYNRHNICSLWSAFSQTTISPSSLLAAEATGLLMGFSLASAARPQWSFWGRCIKAISRWRCDVSIPNRPAVMIFSGTAVPPEPHCSTAALYSTQQDLANRFALIISLNTASMNNDYGSDSWLNEKQHKNPLSLTNSQNTFYISDHIVD